MEDPVYTETLTRLFHVDAAGLEEAASNARALLRFAGPKYATSGYDQYYRECCDLIRKISEEEARRCQAMDPPNCRAVSEGKRRMHDIIQQMFEPEEVKHERQAKEAVAAEHFREEHSTRRKAFESGRRARGLSSEPESGEPLSAVFIHRFPEIDFWDGLEETDENVSVVLAAQKAHKAKQNDETLGDLPIGSSRVGGVPDLPSGIDWPTLEGKKIPFIAQLNLADFPATHQVLPADGHLFVFVLADNDYAHRPPPTAVFLHRGPARDFIRAQRPVDPDEAFRDWADNSVYDMIPVSSTFPEGTDDEPEDAALGHLFGEMQEYYGTPGESAGYALADGDDWIVLLEVGSVGSMEWSDSGSLYLLICREALARLDFSNVVAAVCSS